MQELEKILEEIDQEKKNAALSIRHTTGYKAGQIRIAERIEEIIRKHMNDGWIPVEEKVPDSGIYIFLSFTNFTLPMIGRYEKDSDGGAFYIGDEEETCVSQDLYVNAWRPLPEPYKPKQQETCKYTGGSCCWPIDQCSDCPNNPERSENDQ